MVSQMSFDHFCHWCISTNIFFWSGNYLCIDPPMQKKFLHTPLVTAKRPTVAGNSKIPLWKKESCQDISYNSTSNFKPMYRDYINHTLSKCSHLVWPFYSMGIDSSNLQIKILTRGAIIFLHSHHFPSFFLFFTFLFSFLWQSYIWM